MKKTLVVLPSYNESQNILALIEAVLAQGTNYSVCVVDDSSPDGTSQLISKTLASRPDWKDKVQLITRSKKDGRGGAVREGFQWGLNSNHNFEVFVEMDCDFSHEPKELGHGLSLLNSPTDIVIGARYPRGTIVGWPRRRRVFSFFANLLARFLIDTSVSDYTNGFRFYSARAVRALLEESQRFKGYIYLSESLSQLLRKGFKVTAFPIYFKNRERGVSNTNFNEIKSALQGILSIGWEHRFGRK